MYRSMEQKKGESLSVPGRFRVNGNGNVLSEGVEYMDFCE
jgi:hypothetical protein